MTAPVPSAYRLFACRLVISAACLCSVTPYANAQLPSDVRQSHWAANAVKQVLANHVMSTQADHQFHGEAHVTRQEAVIAIAAIARQLESGSWHLETAKAVPDKVNKTLSTPDWQSKPVTRYEMASVLARFGNYFASAVTRPAPGTKNLGKSTALADKVTIGVPVSSPAYPALKYLADGRMIAMNSDLLKANTEFVKAAVLSRAIAQAAAGLVDRMTELGQDSDGNTPDSTFHNRKTVTPSTLKRP
jgi:S-layer homology domain